MTASNEKQSKDKEVERILQNVERDSEKIGFSNMDRIGRVAEDDADDPVVIAGKRVGRALGYVALGFLVIYLASQYLF